MKRWVEWAGYHDLKRVRLKTQHLQTEAVPLGRARSLATVHPAEEAVTNVRLAYRRMRLTALEARQ